MHKGTYNQDREVTCSCTRKKSSITWDIAREMYARDVCRIAAMLCDSMLCCMPCERRQQVVWRQVACVVPPPEVGLSYGKSKSIVARRVSNLQAVADTRWRSMAGRTVKCGKRFRYAFRSF
ncbi:hypothetical protein TIFTF001_034293 [Ficus carica]|uniref:Uncharacterized protein n=1 Tax=Ficus carica TaxID=3494 RepID=A0AA88E3H3_FICCA|nr:hypothetical protein TIFTF001_034293 [Ficus carica]